MKPTDPVVELGVAFYHMKEQEEIPLKLTLFRKSIKVTFNKLESRIKKQTINLQYINSPFLINGFIMYEDIKVDFYMLHVRYGNGLKEV